MKVFHVLPSLCVGGMEMLSINLASTMREAGHDAGLISIDGAGALDDVAESLRVPLHHVNSNGWRTLFARSPLSEFLEQERPDVVHSHNGSWGRAVSAARFARVPVVAHTMHGFHEHDVTKMRWIERACIRRTDVVISVSEELRHDAIKHLWADGSRIRVVRNGIQVTRRPQSVSRTDLGLSPDHLVVIAVGRLVPVKAHADLVRAFALVAAQNARAHLLLVGAGPERARLESLVRDHQLDDKVTLLGERQDVAGLLSLADCFCLPSLSEGLSISLLEAMGAGLPVVATAVGMSPQLVTPNVGAVVPPADVPALAAALGALLADRSELRTRGAAAADVVRTEYSITKTATEYLTSYEHASRSRSH